MTTRLSFFVALSLAVGSLYAQSQATTGSIEGSVSDATGRQGVEVERRMRLRADRALDVLLAEPALPLHLALDRHTLMH